MRSSGSFDEAAFLSKRASFGTSLPCLEAHPVSIGFITPTLSPFFLRVKAREAAKNVFPAFVSVPVIKKAFFIGYFLCRIVNSLHQFPEFAFFYAQWRHYDDGVAQGPYYDASLSCLHRYSISDPEFRGIGSFG